MLKNYTVIVKNVKKERNNLLLNYLNDEHHKNHTNKSTDIYELSNREQFKKITAEKLKNNELNYYDPNKGYKGGRKLKVVNKSFTFNLPKSYKKIASVEKCKELDLKLKKGIMTIYKQFGIDIDINELYSVLHYQDNPHIHIVIPYLDKKGNTIRDIKPKGFTSRLKILFSQVVDKTLGTEINEYETLNNTDNGTNKSIQALKEIKDWYKTLIRIDKVESKYYKNQIISIERLLEADKEITQTQLTKINENMQKASNMRTKNKKTTPTTPYT